MEKSFSLLHPYTFDFFFEILSQIATKIGSNECCLCFEVCFFGECVVACLRGDFRNLKNQWRWSVYSYPNKERIPKHVQA